MIDRLKVENHGVDERIFNLIVDININTHYHRFMGMDIFKLGPSYCAMKIDLNQNHMNPRKVAHGSVAFALLDTAMGMAVRTAGYEITTVEMNINFTGPATENSVMIAEGWVTHLGRRIVVTEGKVTDDKGKLLAVGRETMFNLGDFLSYHGIK
jgi:acyl-CoA thioesterase